MPAKRDRSAARRDRDYPLLRELKANSDVPRLLRLYGAHAMGIARKRVDGKETADLALVFYVTSKRDADELTALEAVPETIEFRTQKDQKVRRLRTDVVESPRDRFEGDPETRHRPVPGGVSGGINGSTGTIGGWVWDRTDDTIVMLSNAHVFGTTAGTDILQPGTADGGSLPADKIGDVVRGIPRTATGTNTVDCAIGSPDASDIYDLNVHDIGPAVYAVAEPSLDLLVEKYGQTTEHTFGRIIDADYSTDVDDPDGNSYFFEDCIRLEPVSPSADWSAGGDSGSVVFAQTPISEGGTTKPAVGLHFAGGGIYGVACKIQNVFAALDVTTLCAGSFENFLDSLGGSEAEVEREPALVGSFARRATTFDVRTRFAASAVLPKRGLARDVQGRLQATAKGRRLTGAIDTHRGELLTMLTRNGDVRRSAVAALRPLTSGKVTTEEVFETVLDEVEITRLQRLAETVRKQASPDLAAVVEQLQEMLAAGKGRSIGAVFGVRG